MPAAGAISLASLLAGGVAVWIVAKVAGVEIAQAVVPALSMAAMVWALALISLVPIRMLDGVNSNPQYVVAACMAGTTLRMVISLFGAAAAVALFDLQAKPVAVALLAVYLPVLAVEVAMLGCYIRSINAAGSSDSTAAMEVSV